MATTKTALLPITAPVVTTTPAAYVPAEAAGVGGTAPTTVVGTADDYASGYTKLTNPWEAALQANYEAASANPYASQWSAATGEATSLLGRDYEGDLRAFAQEDVQNQITAADNQLGSIGMRELALRSDVQADRAKLAADASTQAMIDSQAIKQSALDSATATLSAASGAELDRVEAMISAASSGAENFLDFETLSAALEQQAKDNADADEAEAEAEAAAKEAETVAKNAAALAAK